MAGLTNKVLQNQLTCPKLTLQSVKRRVRWRRRIRFLRSLLLMLHKYPERTSFRSFRAVTNRRHQPVMPNNSTGQAQPRQVCFL